MKKNNKAFTLIEVIVATGILMISVFWVYKLIWENAKLINNSDNYLQLNLLFSPLSSCIDKLWYSVYFWDMSSWAVYKYDFENESMTWCALSNTWIITLDNIDYELSSMITATWSEFIDFDLIINAQWVWKQNMPYRLIK